MKGFYVSLLICMLLVANCYAGDFSNIQTQAQIKKLVKKHSPRTLNFVKDKPIAGYEIRVNSFAKLHPTVQKYLGKTDTTSYSDDYIKANCGSIVALQMNGQEPDFYIIGMDTWKSKYQPVAFKNVVSKNPKLCKALNEHAEVKKLLRDKSAHIIGALKTTVVKMIRMSAIGYPVDAEIMIQSPWGGQTKPAGQDAFLVFDDSKNQYYMVNIDEKGLPISYIPAKK